MKRFIFRKLIVRNIYGQGKFKNLLSSCFFPPLPMHYYCISSLSIALLQNVTVRAVVIFWQKMFKLGRGWSAPLEIPLCVCDWREGRGSQIQNVVFLHVKPDLLNTIPFEVSILFQDIFCITIIWISLIAEHLPSFYVCY